MNIEEAKRIPLEDYLRRMGFSPVRTGGQFVVPLAFQTGAYPLIQGQPFQKPVNRLRRGDGRKHHRPGAKAVRDARHILRIEGHRGTLPRVHARPGTPEGGRHASGIRGAARLAAP